MLAREAQLQRSGKHVFEGSLSLISVFLLLKYLQMTHTRVCITELSEAQRRHKNIVMWFCLINLAIAEVRSKDEDFYCLLAKVTFIHSVQYKGRAQNVDTSQWLEFCLNKFIDWAWPLFYTFSPPIIWKGASKTGWIEPTAMNFLWKLLEIFLLVQSFGIFKGHF